MKVILIAMSLFFSFSIQAATIDKVIGQDELILVAAHAQNIPLRYRALVDAFGKISMNCTATHIGHGYVLTAGHCFLATPTAQKDLDCKDINIEWGVREEIEPYLKSQCEKIIIQQTDYLNDYAVMKVSPIPPVAIMPEMKRRATIGDTLTVFSHPNKLPLYWSQFCGVERQFHGDLPKNTIQHKCDTNPGSSGASLINTLSLKVVGIHDGGVDGIDGINDPNLRPVNTGMNYGTFIMNSPLFEALTELGFR